MKKIKGMVLESNNKYTLLITPEGQYLKNPSRGQLYDVGSEVTIEEAAVPPRRNWLSLGALAASALMVVGLFIALQFSAAAAPAAFLDLDINPSLSLTLDAEGRVLEFKPRNTAAERVLKSTRVQGEELKGQTAQEAVEQLLDECLAMEYLFLERENTIFISLAAPENYILSSQQIQAAVRNHILQRELDAYLKVSSFGLQEGEEARGNNVSLNAIRLKEEIDEKGLAVTEDSGAKNPGPPPVVQEMLKEVPAARVLFNDDEFIDGRGRSEDDKGKPQESRPSPGDSSTNPPVREREERQDDPADPEPQGKEPPVPTPPSLLEMPEGLKKWKVPQ